MREREGPALLNWAARAGLVRRRLPVHTFAHTNHHTTPGAVKRANLQRGFAEAEGVGDYGDGAEAHGGAG